MLNPLGRRAPRPSRLSEAASEDSSASPVLASGTEDGIKGLLMRSGCRAERVAASAAAIAAFEGTLGLPLPWCERLVSVSSRSVKDSDLQASSNGWLDGLCHGKKTSCAANVHNTTSQQGHIIPSILIAGEQVNHPQKQ